MDGKQTHQSIDEQRFIYEFQNDQNHYPTYRQANPQTETVDQPQEVGLGTRSQGGLETTAGPRDAF